MKCPKCGQVVEDKMAFCPACGTKLVKPEPKQKEDTTSRTGGKSGTGGGKLPKGAIYGIGAVLILIVLLLLKTVLFPSMRQLNSSDYISVQTSGVSTIGTAYLSLDSSKLFDDITEKRKFSAQEEEDLKGILSSLIGQYTISQSEGIANGDKITVTSEIDKNVLKKYRCRIKNTELSVTVDSLREPQEIDLTSYMTVTFTGVAPSAVVTTEVDYSFDGIRDTSLADISYNEFLTLENGDIYSGDILYDEEALLEKGYIVTNNHYEYTVSGLTSYQIQFDSMEDDILKAQGEILSQEADEYFVNRASYDESDGITAVDWSTYRGQLESAIIAVQTGDYPSNLVYLIYHGAVLARNADYEFEQKDMYYISRARNIEQFEDGTKGTAYWETEAFFSKEDLEDRINSTLENVGEDLDVQTLVKEDVEEIVLDTYSMEDVEVTEEEPGDAADSEPLSEIALLSTEESSIVESVTDSYGKDHENALFVNARYQGAAVFALNGSWSQFTATMCTAEKADGEENYNLYIWGDGKLLYSAYGYNKVDAPKTFTVSVEGVQKLEIQADGYKVRTDGGIYLTEAVLIPAETTETALTETAPLSDTTLVDANNLRTDAVRGMIRHSSVSPHWEWLEFSAYTGDETYAVWNLNQEYTGLTGSIYVKEGSVLKENGANLQILGDGEVLWETEGLTVFDQEVLFEVDVTDVALLEMNITLGTDEETYLDAVVYVTDSMLKKPAEEAAEVLIPEITYQEVSASIEEEATKIVATEYHKYYRFDQERITRSDAADRSEKAGGRLATPKTAEENAAVRETARGGDRWYYWLGGMARGITQKWDDGSKITYSNWEDGSPDGDSTWIVMHDSGEWATESSEDTNGYILEVDAINAGEPEERENLYDIEWTDSYRSNRDSITIDGLYYPYAIWMDSESSAWITMDLEGRYAGLEGYLSVSEKTSVNDDIDVAIFGDGKLLWIQRHINGNTSVLSVDVDLSGVQQLTIRSRCQGERYDGDIALWKTYLTPADSAEANTDRLSDVTLIDNSNSNKDTSFYEDRFGNMHDGVYYFYVPNESSMVFNLDGAYETFIGNLMAGNNMSYNDIAGVTIKADGEVVFETEECSLRNGIIPVEIDVTGKTTLEISVAAVSDIYVHSGAQVILVDEQLVQQK